MKKLMLGSNPVLLKPVQFVEDEPEESVKYDESVENVVDEQEEVVPREADFKKQVNRNTTNKSHTTFNETIRCIGEVTMMQMMHAPTIRDDENFQIEFEKCRAPSNANLQSFAEYREDIEPIRDMNESLFVGEEGAHGCSEISSGGTKTPNESSAETINYEISHLEEILGDNSHRLNKEIPTWATDGQLLKEQLYRSNPILLEQVKMGNSEQDECANAFPPCNRNYKLFPGAKPSPRPRK